MPRILILGGTTEARELAAALAGLPDIDARLSLAGRTAQPMAQAVPVITGGFGGAEGLARYLEAEGIDLLIDATHPFAARMSRNAADAAAQTKTAVFALCRPAWDAQDGDRWIPVPHMEAAVDALGQTPRRVFLAIGRQQAPVFERAPQHHYLLRSVDPVTPPLALPDIRCILDHGPFDVAGETRLLAEHRIAVLVTKNSGGSATYAKIAAARALNIPVVMVAREKPPGVPTVATVAEALALIHHGLPMIKRGV